MVRAAFDGDIRFFISDFPTGYYQLVANDAIERFEGGTTLFVEDIHAGVQVADVALLEFIDEGFKRISSEDIAGLRHHWFVPVQPWPNWMMPATATAGLGLLAIVLLVHYLTLRRTVMSKTRALDETIRALEQANKELSIRAKMDRLTGLPNRYRFDEVIEFETERATRYGRPLVLALLDLDRFKQINDTHGHPAGDAVLVHLAGIVTGQLRKSDVMVRLGGDEFAIILPEIELDQARPMLERLRREVADNPLLIDGETVKLSVSIGAAAYDRRESVERWIQHADQDLYRHKRLLQD
jgi:diguanylate cyclase (GGDEF)-like protein